MVYSHSFSRYHPHHHKLTEEQTKGGAFGMLVIEDDYSQLKSWTRPENEKILQISNADTLLGNGFSPERKFASNT